MYIVTKETIDARYVSTTVETPNGNEVEVFQNLTWAEYSLLMTGDPNAYNDTVAAAICSSYLSQYSSAELIRNSNPKYNCHSYAWHSTSASNPYWMNDPSLYISDESYTESTYVRNARVTYTSNGTIHHSGIVTADANSASQVTVRSKWGAFGLFEHNVSDSPYTRNPYYGQIAYWEM